ncbi:MAG: PrsW family intramembrane metalloprotease [Lachnospiraceae bacterium]|nr:PrsW family intramembrane metalloprotease [Lachnospiraceae bacterium]
MENLTIILFLCVSIPILPVIFLLPDQKSRQFLGFLLGGTTVCLISSEVNDLLLAAFGNDLLYVTTNITPVSEEILKAIPILFYAEAVSDDRNMILANSFAMGLGFALLENLVILTRNISTVSIAWAFARGMGAALMHSTCTSLVGLGISYVRKRRKLFYCGTFSLLITAITYHAIFNTLIQSHLRVWAFVLPALLSLLQLWMRFGWMRMTKS